MTEPLKKVSNLKKEGWEYLDKESDYVYKVLVSNKKIDKKKGPYANGLTATRWTNNNSKFYNWFKSPFEGIKIKDIIKIVAGQNLHKIEDKINFMNELLSYTEKEINSLRVLLSLKK
jgi:hypothetical protein